MNAIWNAEVERILISAIKWAGLREVCGFLLTNSAHSEIVFGKNLSPDGGSFLLSPADVERIMNYSKLNHFQVAAFVHSHPVGTIASAGDLNGIRSSPFPWMIVSLEGEKIVYQVYCVSPQGEILISDSF
jgi:proteasome lid subunit RPN8/RPN11